MKNSKILTSLREVFGNVNYIFIAVISTVIVFIWSMWLPNFRLIWQIISSSSVSLYAKIAFLVSLLGSIQTNFSILSATYTIAIAVLFGINISMVIYYLREKKEFLQQTGTAAAGVGGLISGAFGIGCAACGTIVLGPLLALIGAGGIIAFLPFGGQEFGFLGVGLIGFSVILTAKKIQDPIVCDVNTTTESKKSVRDKLKNKH